MNKIYQIISFIKHLISAGNEHSLHSPYLFNLYNETVNNKHNFYCFEEIETLRKALAQYPQQITVKDFGTGKDRITTSSDIITRSSKPAGQAQFIFRLVNFLKPKISLEIGTNLGFTTVYIAKANESGKVFSLEGAEGLVKLALLNFEKAGVKNIELVKGNFDITLGETLKKIETIDFVYFDGNHTKAATLNYFEQCLEKANENTVFLFDDIYWSKDMTNAWNKITENDKIKISIDFYYFGLVFFRAEHKYKQHFKLKL